MNRTTSGVIRWVIFLLVVLSGCASAPPAPRAESSSPLEQVKNREVANLKVWDFSAEGPFFQSKVPAVAPPVINREKQGFLIMVDLGAGTPVVCRLYDRPLRPAEFLRGVYVVDMARTPNRRIEVIDSGVIDGKPYLYLEAPYLADDPSDPAGPKLYGTIKAVAIPLPERTLTCFHDLPGYRKTFKEVFSTMASSMRFGNKPAHPDKYVEIQIHQYRNMNIGYSWLRTYDLGNGRRMELLQGDQLLLWKPEELVSVHATNGEEVLSSGLVAQGRYLQVENGEVLYDMALRSAKDGKAGKGYEASGSARNEKIASSFAVPGGIQGTLEIRRKILSVAHSGKPAERLVVPGYLPQLNPSRASDITIEVGPPTQGKVTYKSQVGSLVTVVDLNESGTELSSSVSAPDGEPMFTGKLQYSQGSY